MRDRHSSPQLPTYFLILISYVFKHLLPFRKFIFPKCPMPLYHHHHLSASIFASNRLSKPCNDLSTVHSDIPTPFEPPLPPHRLYRSLNSSWSTSAAICPIWHVPELKQGGFTTPPC
ncbi:hypothetical protein BDZ91DRAFT_711197 [Kalaharituber pfeilii]|nr:hypothetical protein BDZ91DRAFT_711197 [Kalaharituber pfeilii]